MTVWRMRVACWIPKATNTYSEYVVLIAFPRQEWLCEGASVLTFICTLPLFLYRICPGAMYVPNFHIAAMI